MRPEEVPAELVEKAASALSMLRHGIPDEYSEHTRREVRVALAAVLPEVQAQALREAADEMRCRDDHFSWDEIHRGSEWLAKRAARLTANPAHCDHGCVNPGSGTCSTCRGETEGPTT